MTIKNFWRSFNAFAILLLLLLVGFSVLTLHGIFYGDLVEVSAGLLFVVITGVVLLTT